MNRETPDHHVNGSGDLSVISDCEVHCSSRQPNPDSFRRYSVSDLSKSPEDLYTSRSSAEVNKNVFPTANCGNVSEPDESVRYNQQSFLTNPAFWMFQLLAQYSTNLLPVASPTITSSSIAANYGDTKPTEWSFQLDTSVEFGPQCLAKPFDGSKPEPPDYRVELADSKKLYQHGLYCSVCGDPAMVVAAFLNDPYEEN
ncbi:hypothetical protein AHF37_08039 [Paragonimus kellicotti]|nr:hypothetical protein AHF37_08039 [Paragonimus kellicotti]